MTQHELILASSSPYRRELLSRLNLAFTVVSPDIDETALPSEAPQATALRLAQLKARAVAALHPHALIIGCDQVATLDGVQLGKPMSHDNAVAQLQRMRGRSVTFHSALCLLNATSGSIQVDNLPYQVEFRNVSDAQIENYLRIEQPYNCAGSAKSEGLGIALIASMTGSDPNALIGLPLIRLVTMLQNEGVHII